MAKKNEQIGVIVPIFDRVLKFLGLFASSRMVFLAIKHRKLKESQIAAIYDIYTIGWVLVSIGIFSAASYFPRTASIVIIRYVAQ